MKNALLVLKIGTLLAIVFACGMWVGRLTAPSQIVETVVTVDSDEAKSWPDRMTPQVRYVFTQYARSLELDAGQQMQIAPIFEEAGRRVEEMPRYSEARQREFESVHQQMAQYLKPDQKKEAERILEIGRQKMIEMRK